MSGSGKMALQVFELVLCLVVLMLVADGNSPGGGARWTPPFSIFALTCVVGLSAIKYYHITYPPCPTGT